MKTIQKSLHFFTVLVLLALHGNSYSASDAPNFELVNNDTKQDVYFYFGKSELKSALNEAKKVGVGKLIPNAFTKAGSLAAMSKVSPQHNILIIMPVARGKDKFGKEIDTKLTAITSAYVYFFKPSAIGKKLYLSYGPNFKLEPQKGAFFGLGSKSKGGYPLENNVTKDDILYSGVHSIAKVLNLPEKDTEWTKVEPYWVESGAYQ